MKTNLQVLLKNEIETIEGINPKLARILKSISKKENEGTIIKSEFSFGESIFEKGSTRLSDSPEDIGFLLIVDRGAEVFIEGKKQTTPIAALQTGQIFSLNNEYHLSPLPPQLLNMTAGARSIFLYPIISNFERHNKMFRYYNFDHAIPAPHLTSNQWHMFKGIAEANNSSWRTTILFFGNEWLNGDTVEHHQLRDYLRDSNVPNTSFYPKKMAFELLVSQAIDQLNFKPDPFLADNLKHVFAIANHFLPGHVFADDEQFAPIKMIQDAFMEQYKLSYAPNILIPGYATDERVCYHSIQDSMMIEYAPQQRKKSSHLTQLRELARVFEQTKNFFEKNYQPELAEFFDTKLEIFHPHGTADISVAPDCQILHSDPVLQKQVTASNKRFAKKSHFTSQGCISICRKQA